MIQTFRDGTLGSYLETRGAGEGSRNYPAQQDPEPEPPPEAERRPLASRIAQTHRPRGDDGDEG